MRGRKKLTEQLQARFSHYTAGLLELTVETVQTEYGQLFVDAVIGDFPVTASMVWPKGTRPSEKTAEELVSTLLTTYFGSDAWRLIPGRTNELPELANEALRECKTALAANRFDEALAAVLRACVFNLTGESPEILVYARWVRKLVAAERTARPAIVTTRGEGDSAVEHVLFESPPHHHLERIIRIAEWKGITVAEFAGGKYRVDGNTWEIGRSYLALSRIEGDRLNVLYSSAVDTPMSENPAPELVDAQSHARRGRCGERRCY
ncbi:MAG: hypothetical protein AAF411_07280 [Myxococcota bacterium]